MSAPSPGTCTTFRLVRITALVLGCLVFLHACERSTSALLGDVWVEAAIGGGLGVAGLIVGWFEVALNARLADGDAAGRGAGWDDTAEPEEAPIRGNSPRRSGPPRWDDIDEQDHTVRTGRATRPRDADEESPPVGISARTELIAWISRTLRIGKTGRNADEPEWSARAAWNALATRLRRGEPDEDADLLEHDGIDIERTETGELIIESGGSTIRAKIIRSGDLVFHGRAGSDVHPQWEWKWTFRPDTFPAIRAALGAAPGDLLDLLDLLEHTVPQLDPVARHDPGAWLRAHDIVATYREKGVSAAQATRELPALRPGPPELTPARTGSKQGSASSSAGARGASSPTPHDHHEAFDSAEPRFLPRRERPSAAATSRDNQGARSTQHRPAHPQHDDAPYRETPEDADRRARDDEWPTARPNRRSDQSGPAPMRYDPAPRTARRRTDSDAARPDRDPYPPEDSGPLGRDRTASQEYRRRPRLAPSDHAAEQANSQSPSGRRHRRDPPSPPAG
ncbi:hypothetical protein AB0C34_03240 [Nocardia sp. NPDC049220]|uniref:hypothetical protein n=1 Tax=Nocardia sp. NPDC049220 TaxID=3155273 RepID=UPI0033C5929C